MEIFEKTFTEVWAIPFLGYSVGELGMAFLVFFAILGIVKLFRVVFLQKFADFAEKTANKWDDKIVEILTNLSQLFYVAVAFFLSVKLFVPLDPQTNKWITNVFVIVMAWEALRSGQRFLGFALEKTKIAKDKTSLHGLKMVANILLWSVGALLLLSNLGINVSALAASFGIGGIAIALAAQNILGDLFSSFTIYFDKPFSVGDYIVVGANDGTVKKIGLKTTRIQTLQGEELVISNKELTETRVQNFRKLKRRRVSFTIGLTYDTPIAKLKKVSGLIEAIIKKTKLATFDRCRFHTFGDFSLGFDTVYFVESGDYAEYTKVQEDINFALLEAFEKEKIEMAFPTQTVHLVNSKE